ncbi:type IV secretion protein Rhs, partial [Pseudomonas alliivorans]|nr:type IV secretion protein Rhs [Pseudomonas alliivorans]
PDPIKLAGGLNNYQYVPNPTGWVDPLGLSGECPDSERNKIPAEEASTPSLASVNSDEVKAPDVSRQRYLPGNYEVNPKEINFTQPGVSANGEKYVEDMRNNNWDWNRSGPLRVMNIDGQLVSYDNRRLRAARIAELELVPVKVVDPNEMMPDSNSTWQEKFDRRRRMQINLVDGKQMDPKGLNSLPSINPPKVK